MSTSISSPDDSFFDAPDPRALIRVFESAGFPPPRHAAEPDLFVRQQDVPGHDQAALADARILIVGAGGLGEPILSGLNLNDHATILEGAIPAALLALLVQGLFDLLDRFLIPRGLRL